MFASGKCLFCNKTVLNKQICDDCLNNIFFIYSPLCIECQKESIDGTTHIKCRKKFGVDKLITCFEFSGVARDCILQSKFGPKAFNLTKNLIDYALVYKEQFGLTDISEDFAITSIPSDPQRLKVRGFNLAEIIAKHLSKKLNLKYKKLLCKNKQIEPFEKLNKNLRKDKIKNAFKISTEKLPNKVLIVDDVITTGATLTEAGRLLKKNGVKQVIAYTLCFKPLHNTNPYTKF